VAVISVEKLFEGRTGSDNLERTREYSDIWEVLTDDDQDDPTVAGGTALLPRLGEPHPNDSYAVVVSNRPMQDATTPRRWLVTIGYSSNLPVGQQREALAYDSSGQPSENAGATSATGGGGTVERQDDPRNRPPTFEVDWEEKTEIVRRDINGDAITNSAEDPFDPPPTREVALPIITITKNLAIDSPLLNLGTQAEYQDITNSDTPWGFAEKTLRFGRIRHRAAVENDVAYAEFSLSIKVNWETWALFIADAGFRDLDGVWFTDPETKALPADPKPLDGAGFELAVGDPPVFLEYEIYRPVAFIPILALMGVTA
jgi:hypothetical protein